MSSNIFICYGQTKAHYTIIFCISSNWWNMLHLGLYVDEKDRLKRTKLKTKYIVHNFYVETLEQVMPPGYEEREIQEDGYKSLKIREYQLRVLPSSTKLCHHLLKLTLCSTTALLHHLCSTTARLPPLGGTES